MAASFPRDARILRYARPPERHRRVCLAVPAWSFRVIAPELPSRTMDLFERAVLGLCQSGIHDLPRVSELLGLHPRLCAHILELAKASGLLDPRNGLTAEGKGALRTGRVDGETAWKVCHVFQDTLTGQLWPRVATDLDTAHVIGVAPDHVKVAFGTRGEPDDDTAWRVASGDRPPTRPSPLQVIGAARMDQAARQGIRVREFENRNGVTPMIAPEDVADDAWDGERLTRVSIIDDPEAVLVVAFLEVLPPGVGEDWRALDPFGAGESAMLQQLVQRWAERDAGLAARLGGRVDQLSAELDRRFEEETRSKKARVHAQLARELGPEIRRSFDALELMTDFEMAAALPEEPGSIEKAAQATFRLYEELFRRMAAAYPAPVPDGAAPDGTADRGAGERRRRSGAGRSGTLGREIVQELAVKAGFDGVAPRYRTMPGAIDLDKAFIQQLVPICLVSAATHEDHPLRRLAHDRPDLLHALPRLGDLRNRAAHAGRDPTSQHELGWYRPLAVLATRELIRLPRDTQRISD